MSRLVMSSQNSVGVEPDDTYATYTLSNPLWVAPAKWTPSDEQAITVMGEGGKERLRINVDGTFTFPQVSKTVDLARLQAIVEILLEHATPEAKMAVDVLVREE